MRLFGKDKVANILINQPSLNLNDNYKIDPATGNWDRFSLVPIQNGKWDAAHKVIDRPLALNLNSTSFGQDSFDYLSDGFQIQKGYRYQDTFNGVIFFNLLEEHSGNYYVPGLFKNGYDQLAINRTRLIQGGGFLSEQEALKHMKTHIKVNESLGPLTPLYTQKTLEAVDQWFK
jgi:hypothetical protein